MYYQNSHILLSKSFYHSITIHEHLSLISFFSYQSSTSFLYLNKESLLFQTFEWLLLLLLSVVLCLLSRQVLVQRDFLFCLFENIINLLMYYIAKPMTSFAFCRFKPQTATIREVMYTIRTFSLMKVF